MNDRSIVENEANSHHARYVDSLWQEQEGKLPSYEMKRVNSRKVGLVVWRFILNKAVQFEIDENMIDQKQKDYLQSPKGALATLAEFKKNKTMEEILEFVRSS
jgi:hypothetical protein